MRVVQLVLEPLDLLLGRRYCSVLRHVVLPTFPGTGAMVSLGWAQTSSPVATSLAYLAIHSVEQKTLCSPTGCPYTSTVTNDQPVRSVGSRSVPGQFGLPQVMLCVTVVSIGTVFLSPTDCYVVEDNTLICGQADTANNEASCTLTNHLWREPGGSHITVRGYNRQTIIGERTVKGNSGIKRSSRRHQRLPHSNHTSVIRSSYEPADLS